jgi:hypothetical protein
MTTTSAPTTVATHRLDASLSQFRVNRRAALFCPVAAKAVLASWMCVFTGIAPAHEATRDIGAFEVQP